MRIEKITVSIIMDSAMGQINSTELQQKMAVLCIIVNK